MRKQGFLIFLWILPILACAQGKQDRTVIYPELAPFVVNLGPGCRIAVLLPKKYFNGRIDRYIPYDLDASYYTPRTQGSYGVASFTIPMKKLPFGRKEQVNWHMELRCVGVDSSAAKDDFVFDEKAKKWNLDSSRKREFAISELQYELHQLKNKSSHGWMYSFHESGVEDPRKLIYYCLYPLREGPAAICGGTDAGDLRDLKKNVYADRINYVLKILHSIEFLEDEVPEVKKVGDD